MNCLHGEMKREMKMKEMEMRGRRKEKYPVRILGETNKLISKFTWMYKGPRVVKQP